MIQVKKKKEKKIIETAVSVLVVCNSCLKEISVNVEDNNINNAVLKADMTKISKSFDLESKFSGETWSFQLCEDCLLKIIKNLKLYPSGYRENPFSQNQLTPTQKQKKFLKWREK